jgi:hypothetical protein
MRTITAHHILCFHNLRSAFFSLAILNQIIRIVFCKVTSEQSISDFTAIALCWRGFIFCQVP